MSLASPTRRTVLLALAGTCAAAGLGSGASRAQSAAAERHREVALRVARDFVVPGYQALAAAVQDQAEAWAAFRAKPAETDLARLEAAFRAAADAWSGIEAVRVGPIAQDLRYERMAHWPERKNAVGKALSSLLAGAEEFTPERLRRASVAGQGLSALERLLFGDGEGGAGKARRALLAETPAGERRRRLGAAITAGLARTASETLAGWTGLGGQLAKLEQAAPEEARELVTRLATDLLALLEAVAETKIEAVLGEGPDEARPLLAEGWRAGRSLRAVQMNLDAAQAFSRAALAGDEEALRSVLAGLDTARSIAGDLAAGGAPLGDLAADPKRRGRAVLLRDAVAAARELSGRAFAESLAITIGFNSRDGD